MKEVTLSWAEMVMAAQVGVMRQVQNLRLGRIDRYGCSVEDGWTPHIEGACGECALAKCLGLFWSGNLGMLALPDVGKLQVRTASKAHYRLILHRGDADDEVFVLVTGRAPKFTIQGWIKGAEGKREHFWTDPGTGRPAFFIEAGALRSIDDLVR